MKKLNLFVCVLLCILNAKAQQKDTVTFGLMGDIMLGTNFPEKKYLPLNNDCFSLIKPVKEYLDSCNFSFANLEGVLSDTATLEKKCKDTTVCYAFRMPTNYIECLSKAGIDAFCLANNHSGDFGDAGRKNTLALLEAYNIEAAGLLLKPVAVLMTDSIRVGFCAFAPNQGACHLLQTQKAIAIVKGLSDSCDIVVVSFHGGAEGKDYQHITKEMELYYGEKRGNVYEFARKMIDAGADIVFGHGPHVVRAVDVYKNRFIAYSLGNFCTYSRFNLLGPNGLAPLIKVYTTPMGEFLYAKVISFKQTGEGGLQIDTKNKAYEKIKTLTLSDIDSLENIIFKNNLIYLQK